MNSEFTSCDWGTTNLRVRIVRGNAVIKELRTEQGASTLKSPEEFRTALGAAMDSLGAAKPEKRGQSRVLSLFFPFRP
jgi:2-keto-3-deoxy-galactonokinase